VTTFSPPSLPSASRIPDFSMLWCRFRVSLLSFLLFNFYFRTSVEFHCEFISLSLYLAFHICLSPSKRYPPPSPCSSMYLHVFCLCIFPVALNPETLAPGAVYPLPRHRVNSLLHTGLWYAWFLCGKLLGQCLF
jgi:hypothetical protein